MKIKLLFVTFLLITSSSTLAFIPVTPAPTIQDVVLKLNNSAELNNQQVQSVLVHFMQLGKELLRIDAIDSGITTAQRRNLVVAAFKAHRLAALEYLHPNEYRRWMRVASRALPRSSYSLRRPQHYLPEIQYAEQESPAAAAYRASQGN